MALVVFSLVLLCLHILVPLSHSFSPEGRSQDVLENYVVSGGVEEPQSHLFSQCMADARTVEGVLYAIKVADDEEYVRFVPEEVREFEWTAVDLGGDGDIIGCAEKAFDLSAYMFKFDGSCNVALNSSYDPTSEQSCDDAAPEVVYITSRPLSFLNGEFVPIGESHGCYFNSPEGMRYYEGGPLVSERPLPPLEKCSPTADQAYHMVLHCIDEGMNFCEAQARCEAMGLPMASKAFHDDRGASLRPADFPTQSKLFWSNLRKLDGVWQWMPEMVTVPDTDVSPSDFKQDNAQCAIFSLQVSVPPKMFYLDCDSADLQCVLCYDASSTLPPC